MMLDEILLIGNSGTSITIMNDASDFIEPFHPGVQSSGELKGNASGLSIVGLSTAKYTLLDDDGTPFDILGNHLAAS
eukprot:scaffold2595_cov49-Attheya_sp.AAC.4